MNHLQRFVLLLYDRTSECTRVDLCRKLLFAKGRQIDRIPPTEAALKEHIKRAVYQAGYCWGQSLALHQHLPSPGEWGWEKRSDNHWTPFWTSLPEAEKVCKELIKCGCKKPAGLLVNECLFHSHAQSFATAWEPVIDRCQSDAFLLSRVLHKVYILGIQIKQRISQWFY